MSATAATAGRLSAPARQPWILTPVQDTLLVVAAPVLVLAAAVGLFAAVGAPRASASILLLHVVLTVAHHLPTFIRIYGDVDLFRRFKWTFILAPVFPLAFSGAALVYLNARDFPVENVLYLFVLLALWDPWHFLMQHYGFTRIYDRYNDAPKKLASRMDLALSAAWFVFIMLASGEWLAGILEDLFVTANLPVALALPEGAVRAVTAGMFWAATAATLAYGVYVVWCRRRGYFVSVVKLTLFATTFGVMFLAYTPNAWILSWAPGWSFAVGFAVIGIVHMTQYLAIVWRYNRNLAAQPERARAGWFRKLHGRGGFIVGGAYVALCLGYGAALTSQHEGRVVMSVLLALGFTSTLLHYYFDGFIWKLKRKENRENLSIPDDAAEAARTDAARRAALAASASGAAPRSALATLLRHALYFGAPLALLSGGAYAVLNGPGTHYVGYMMRGAVLFEEGRDAEALLEARTALESMTWQLPLARKLAELQPTSARDAALAFLIYNRSHYDDVVIPTLTGAANERERALRRRASVEEAIAVLERALRRGGPLGHPGREGMQPEHAHATLASWRKEV